jgi:glycolate oxidase
MPQTTSYAVLHELFRAAKKNLALATWDYLMGGAETETTLERNRQALDAIAFRPRVLRDVRDVDTSTTLLGLKLSLPVVLAPIGSLQDLHPDGGLAPSRDAAAFGVVHMLSSVSAPGLEAVADSNPHPKFFQLYVRSDHAWVEDVIVRAVDKGYKALCLTVDLDYYGRRERDLAKRYKATARRANPADHYQARFSWSDVARLKKRFTLPFMLKGIATAEDALIALDHGIEVIYVSNHGGRQLDHGKGAVTVLREVADAVRGRAEIMVDGGVMRGADIVKAVALGARVVGIGRLQGLAMAAGGAAAIVRMLELLKDEAMRTLGLLGVRSFAELDASYLAPVAPLPRSWLRSAFPLLDEGY